MALDYLVVRDGRPYTSPSGAGGFEGSASWLIWQENI